MVLDLGLPGMDGLEVCRRIRASSSLPIIMLTARDEEADRVVGLELGADDYVPKPFSPRELAARVKAVLRRSTASPRADAATVGDVSLSRSRHEVHVGDRPVELSSTEFNLLAFLMENAGLVFSREILLERVWGLEFPGGTRTVDQHVAQVRAKLGPARVHRDGPRRRLQGGVAMIIIPTIILTVAMIAIVVLSFVGIRGFRRGFRQGLREDVPDHPPLRTTLFRTVLVTLLVLFLLVIVIVDRQQPREDHYPANEGLAKLDRATSKREAQGSTSTPTRPSARRCWTPPATTTARAAARCSSTGRRSVGDLPAAAVARLKERGWDVGQGRVFDDQDWHYVAWRTSDDARHGLRLRPDAMVLAAGRGTCFSLLFAAALLSPFAAVAAWYLNRRIVKPVAAGRAGERGAGGRGDADGDPHQGTARAVRHGAVLQPHGPQAEEGAGHRARLPDVGRPRAQDAADGDRRVRRAAPGRGRRRRGRRPRS